MQYVSYRIIKDLTSPSMFYYFSYLFPFFIIIFSISYIKTKKKKFKKDRLQRLEVNNDVYLWLLLVTTYNRIRFSEDLWWGGFFIFWMHRAGAGDMTSTQDEIIKEMLSSFLLFIFVFFSLLCCDENLWWITFSLCLLYTSEALFQKYFFVNFFSLLHIICLAKEYV